MTRLVLIVVIAFVLAIDQPRAVQRLVKEEIRLGAEGIVGQMEPKELSEALRSWTESANAILSALHRKTLARTLNTIAENMGD